jgi:hypothetical protein
MAIPGYASILKKKTDGNSQIRKKHNTSFNAESPRDIQELQNFLKGNVENKRPSIPKFLD